MMPDGFSNLSMSACFLLKITQKGLSLRMKTLALLLLGLGIGFLRADPPNPAPCTNSPCDQVQRLCRSSGRQRPIQRRRCFSRTVWCRFRRCRSGSRRRRWRCQFCLMDAFRLMFKADLAGPGNRSNAAQIRALKSQIAKLGYKMPRAFTELSTYAHRTKLRPRPKIGMEALTAIGAEAVVSSWRIDRGPGRRRPGCRPPARPTRSKVGREVR